MKSVIIFAEMVTCEAWLLQVLMFNNIQQSTSLSDLHPTSPPLIWHVFHVTRPSLLLSPPRFFFFCNDNLSQMFESSSLSQVAVSPSFIIEIKKEIKLTDRLIAVGLEDIL